MKNEELEIAIFMPIEDDYDRMRRLLEIENATGAPTNWDVMEFARVDQIHLIVAPVNLNFEEVEL